jgi:ACS family hexuronate transporter-like MFS transporter
VRPEEVTLIRSGTELVAKNDSDAATGVWRTVLTSRNIWGVSIARFFTEQPWAFFIIWIPTYLNTQRHLDMKALGYYGWIPFLAADIGCVTGGYLSPLFSKLGFRLLIARKLAITVPCMTMVFTLFALTAPTVQLALFFFCIGTFSHQAATATILTLPADLMPRHAVATSLGLTGALGFFGVFLSTFVVGRLAEHGHYAPIFWALAFMDLIAAAVIWTMVHEAPQPQVEQGM